MPLPEVDATIAERITQTVIAKSREKYGTPREEVERSLESVGKTIPTEEKEPDPIQEKEQPQAAPPVKKPEPVTYTPKPETQHRYLQMLVKRTAEARGYKAVIEELTPDGKGRVDVSLERGSQRIACEISVTTSDTWEVHNIQKCLAAGYSDVIVCSNDAKNLERIRKQIQSKLSSDLQAKVLLLEPNVMVKYFDRQVIQENPTEKVVHGYRVRTEYTSMTAEELKRKEEQILKAVSESMRKRGK